MQRASTSKRHKLQENPTSGCPNCVRENGFTTGCRSEQSLRYELARLALAALWRGSARFDRGADVAFICPVTAANAAAETSEKSVRINWR
jgi:hypothetical protein